MITYQNEGEEHESDEYWLDVAGEEIKSLLIFYGLIGGGQALLLEDFVDQIVTRGIEQDGDQEHHEEHGEDDHAVETKKVDGGAQSESHNAESKQHHSHNHEDPIKDISTKFHEQENVCGHEAKWGKENQEVEDIEEHINACISFLVINFEGIFRRVKLWLCSVLEYSFFH